MIFWSLAMAYLSWSLPQISGVLEYDANMVVFSTLRRVGLGLLSFTSSGSAGGTNFLNTSQILAGLENPSWFAENVPIVDLPDSQTQAVYYYRWSTWREHLTYTSAQYKWLSTEFLGAVGYAGPYGAINAAAGHHIREGRWIRDQSFVQDLINFWLAGPGVWPKPASYADNPDTYTWGTEYSFWIASAVWWNYLVNGDQTFAISQLDNLKSQYDRWSNHFNSTLGLYWQAPVWDATEYTLASYASSDPYHGGYGFRPTINSYQYGDAMAIAAIAQLAGDSNTAAEYTSRANDLKTNLEKHLWDSDQQFFEHLARDNNPSDALLGAREIMGYIPWMFEMPQSSNQNYSGAFAQLQDPQGFSSPYGPLTAENRSSEFMKDAYTGCCHWDGPSWPFATAQTLVAAENLLNDYPATSSFTSTDYQTLISRYVATQFKNGAPYVAEAHDPYSATWIYDGYDHSEDYNHSTFVDNIIAGLLGLRPQSDNTLVINPLVPSSWDHYAIENAPYHGHSITVIWDSSGSHYGQGSGFQVFVDGVQKINQKSIGKVTVQVGSPITSTSSNLVNIAANPLLFKQGTQASASFTSTSTGDNSTHVIDGSIWRVGIPENARWTSSQSSNPSDWVALDLRRTQVLNNVVLYFYSDNTTVGIPSSYDLQYLNGNIWQTIPSQSRSTSTPTNNAPVTITFPNISASQIRVNAPNPGNGTGWGLSEFQVWAAPVFVIQNVNSGKLMGVQNESTADGALIQQYQDNGSPDHLWQITTLDNGWMKIENLNSGKLLSVQGSSTANSTDLVQSTDTGADDQLWRVQDLGQVGEFLILNKLSGLVAGVTDDSTQNDAQVVQDGNTGTSDQLWQLLPSVPAM